MIDNYALKARVYPVIFLLLPIVVIGAVYSLQFEQLYLLGTSVLITGALMYLFSQLGRDRGKLLESKLWTSWGGMPTIQILRLRNTHIDKNTKARYHQRLQNLCPTSAYPSEYLEQSDADAADDIYRSWTRYLISQTRDASKFSLLLKDNISYGFRRNLLGLKNIAIGLILILSIGNGLYWSWKLNTLKFSNFPSGFYLSSGILFLMLLFWLFVVRPGWVRIPAFSYAERLCEATDQL